jgi:hypothetical protein
MGKNKNAFLRDAGFRSIADALDANQARTTEALWSSVDAVHMENAARLAASQTDAAHIPTIRSVGERKRS